MFYTILQINYLSQQTLWATVSAQRSRLFKNWLWCPLCFDSMAKWFVSAFVFRFADEFSLLVQLQSPQSEERSVFSMLSPDSHVMMQLRISAYAVIFIGTQQRHYEWGPFFCLFCTQMNRNLMNLMHMMRILSSVAPLWHFYAFIYEFIVIIAQRSTSNTVSNKNMLLISIHYPLPKTSRWHEMITTSSSGNWGPLMPIPVSWL